MKENELNKFLTLIRKDILAIEKGINEQEKELKKILEYIKIGDSLFSIDLNYFGTLVNKYALKIDQSDFNDLSESIPKRLDLVEKIFFTKNIDKSKMIYTFNSPWGSPLPNPMILIYQLYYAIFKRYITNSEDISEIFEDLLEQWKYTFNEFKIPIKIITHLPLVIFKGNYQLTDDLELKSVWPYIRLDGNPRAKAIYDNYIHSYFPFMMKVPYDGYGYDFDSQYAPYGVYLFFATELSIQFEKIDHKNFQNIPPFYESLKEEFTRISKKFNQLINTLYLFGYDFKFEDYTIEYPWWWLFGTPNLSKFEFYYKKYSKIITLEKDEIEELKALYIEVASSNLYLENEIIANRYFQVYNRDFFPDTILDSFIILELLLTRGMEMELRYRLSLNGALFLSSNWEEFKKIKKFLKNLYGLRSAIIHGGKWEERITSLIKKKIVTGKKEILFELKAILNSIIRKLIRLKLADDKILDKLKQDNFFFEHSDLFIIKK